MPRTRVKDRPHLLTDATWEALIDDRRAGLTLEDCAAQAGVGLSTLTDWIRDGRAADPDTPLARFADDLQKARIDFKRRHLTRIAAAAEGGEQTTRTTTREKRDANGRVTEIVTETVESEHAGSWQASAWLLERSFPMEFAQVRRSEAFDPDAGGDAPGPDEAPDTVNVRSIIDRIAARQSQGDAPS